MGKKSIATMKLAKSKPTRNQNVKLNRTKGGGIAKKHIAARAKAANDPKKRKRAARDERGDVESGVDEVAEADEGSQETDDSHGASRQSSSDDDDHESKTLSTGLVNKFKTGPAKSNRTFKLLIGSTASVAAIKLVELMRKFNSTFPRTIDIQSIPTEVDIEIKVVITNNVRHFTSIEELQKESYAQIYQDADEWSQWSKLSDPVLHIELRKWADVFLIAPLDANTMAKMANGLCDNLLSCVVRAWDLTKPLIYCPAMNVHMYNHPLTKEHLSKMDLFGYLRIDSVEKRLACGDFGMGGMASVDSIVDFVMSIVPTIEI